MAVKSRISLSFNFSLAIILACVMIFVSTPQVRVHADGSPGPTVIANIPVGGGGYNPWGLAVNSTTNKIYVANDSSNNVSVIDGATNNILTTISVGTNPQGISLNSATNRIYVANNTSNNVSVIDGVANNVIAAVPVGIHPLDMVSNPSSNQTYVVNNGSNTVSQIHGATNTVVGTFNVGISPMALAINISTGFLYVANYGSNNVSILNFNSGELVATVPVGIHPVDVEVDSVANRIFVSNNGSNTISVIDGFTNNVLTTINNVAVSTRGLAANSSNHRIYAANDSNGTLAVIDGTNSSVLTTLNISVTSHGLAVNSATNRIYLTNYDGNTFSVIDGPNNNTIATVNTGVEPASAAVNPVTNSLYVTNYDSNKVSVINTTNNAITSSINVGVHPTDVAVNTLTNKIYVANYGSNTVSVINGADNSVLFNINVGTRPTAVTVSESANRVYIANYGSNTVTVFNGADSTFIATINVGNGPKCMTRNPGPPELVYVANYASNTISIIDVSTNNVTTTITNPGSGTSGIAVNSSTHRIYVTNDVSNTLSVLDCATNNIITTVNVGNHPGGVAVNPVNNRVYVANLNNNNISVISGATNNLLTTTSVGNWPEKIAINSGINRIYVTNRHCDTVTVLQDSVSSTTGMVSSANSSDQGQAVTFTATVSGSGGTPTGTVNFNDGSTLLGTGTLNDSGVTNYTTSILTAGNHTINAVYSGDANFASSTGSLTQQVIHITFPDTNLEAAIRQAIDKPSGDIYQSDLVNLVSLTAENKGIAILSGLEYCKNLQVLDLNQNQIGDISQLSALLRLQTIRINSNRVNNISALANLFNLTTLDLGANQISAVSVLSGLPGLIYLNLGGNQVSNIAPLANLSLHTLILNNNQVSNISILSTIPSLQELNLNGNRINSLAALSGLTGLQQLDLGSNQISDVSALANLNSLQNLYLNSNQITNISVLAANQGLGTGDYLNLAYNMLSINTGSQNMADIQTLLSRGANIVYQPQITITTLSSSRTPSVYGQNVNFIASVVPIPDGGTVQFTVNGANQGAPISVNSAGQAILATSSLPAGNYTVTAIYSGDASFVGSTSPVLAQTVSKAPAAVTWSNPADIVYGTYLSDTQLNATVSIPGTFSYTPAAGTVLGAGARNLNVSFNPLDSVNYTTGTANVTLNVSKAVLNVAVDNKNMLYSQPVPALTVQFSGFVNGDTQSAVSGSPALITSATSTSLVGIYQINVSQGTLQAANYTFTFTDGSITITQASTSATLSASSNPANIGYPVTFSFRVRPVSPAAGIPAGEIIFGEGANQLGIGSLDGSGIANFTTGDLAEGTHTISAQFTGDANFAGSSASIIENMVTSVGLILHGASSVGTVMEAEAPVFNSAGLGAVVGSIVKNGSDQGISDLLNGTNGGCNIAMSARPLTPDEAASLTSYAVAKDATVMIVNRAVPSDIVQLTLAQIRGIYEGTYTNWNQVGSATDMPIVARARNIGSGNREVLIQQCAIVGASEQSFIAGRGLARLDSDALMQQTINDAANGSIGYANLGFGAGPSYPNIREVKVVNPASSNSYSADARSIYSGSYPLTHFFYLVTRNPADSNQMLLIDWICELEGQGQAIVVTTGFLKLVPDQDVRIDNIINGQDLVVVGGNIGASNPGHPHWIRSDVKADGVVNGQDLVQVAGWVGTTILAY